jgi:hypothetical protein
MFLGVCVAIALALGILRIFVLGPVIARADAETALMRMGATIYKGRTQYDLPDPRFPRRSPPPPPPQGTSTERLLSILTWRDISFRQVTEISFWTAHRFPTDDDIRLVLQFPEVEKLDLTLGKVWDLPGGGHASTNIGSEDITDRSVAAIAELPNLRQLVLGKCNVSDAALEALSKSRSLENFGLHDSQITDAGLLHLARVQSLTDLYVANNKGITVDGVREFCRRRPDVAVSSGFSSAELGMEVPMPRPDLNQPRPTLRR